MLNDNRIAEYKKGWARKHLQTVPWRFKRPSITLPNLRLSNLGQWWKGQNYSGNGGRITIERPPHR